MTVEEKRAYWTALVERWEADGGTRKAFCERNDLSYAVFQYWVGKIRGAEMKPASPFVCVEIDRSDRSGTTPDDSLEFETDGIRIAVGNDDALVTVHGRLSVGLVRRIVAACHVSA